MPIKRAITKASPGGGTPLNLAVQRGYAEASKRYAEGYANQLLIITDGNNEDSGSKLTLSQHARIALPSSALPGLRGPHESCPRADNRVGPGAAFRYARGSGL